METLISAAGQLRSRSWRKCADIIGRTVLKFHERSYRSNFIFLAHFRLLFTLSITLMALQALFLATFQKMTPNYATSDYVAFLSFSDVQGPARLKSPGLGSAWDGSGLG